MAKKISTYRWTVETAASEFGIDRRTLTTRLKSSGIMPGGDGLFSTLDIANAIYGDMEREKIRKVRADADIAEIERDKELHLLLYADGVFKLWEGILGEVRQGIDRSTLTEPEKAQVLATLRDLRLDDYLADPDPEAEDADPAAA